MSTKISDQVSSSDLVLDEEAAFDDLEAKLWGDKVVVLYNGQNHQALYDLFHQQAKVKITEERLAKQLAKLHELFGDIEQIAFTNLIKLGEKNSEVYYQLLFNLEETTLAFRVILNDAEIISNILPSTLMLYLTLIV
tara:strand:- start:8658 stop:9068 length:411 start_codon:yes stop_codon:yes gene_type:complete